MKISFILPTYNSEKTIDKCLDSLTRQTLKDIEIVCIDDKSSDNTVELLKKRAEHDNRIRIICNAENKGTFLSRKRGVMEAKGEYIMFCDNDDYYEQSACENLYKKITEQNVDILAYDAIGFILDENGETEIVRNNLMTKPENKKGKHCLNIDNRLNLLWNKIVRAEVCKKAYDASEDVFLTIAEDTYACFLIHYFAKSYSTIQETYYHWNIGSGVSNDNNMSLKQYESLCKCMKDYENATRNFLSSHENAEEHIRIFEEKGGSFPYCIARWRTGIAEMDAGKALDILRQYYDWNDITNNIRTKWTASINSKTDAERKNAELILKNKEKSKKIKYWKSKYNSVVRSKSWKMTKPFRRALKTFK